MAGHHHAPGDVLLAFLTFTDGQGMKRRPVLVVYDFSDADLLVLPITSHPARKDSDILVAEWQAAGLRLPSIVRAAKFATVAKSSVDRKLGRLSSADHARVKVGLTKVVQQFLT